MSLFEQPGGAALQRWYPYAIYVLAVLLTLATFLLRQEIAVSFGERPLLILFMFPILVSALLGGFGPGLMATLAAAACTAYIMPPAGSFAIGASFDVLQWLMLIVNGVLASLLSEFLHRSRQREADRWRQLADTQDQLSQSEIRFQATFERAAIGLALVSTDGRWLRINDKLCEVVGYSQEELLALTFQDITYPDDLDTDLEFMRQMLDGEISSYAMEKRYFRKDGNLVWINLTVALVRQKDGTPDYFVSAVEDIQARKETEAALQEKEAALQAAQQLAAFGNWQWDLRTGTHYWSEQIYRIYGRDPALPPAVYPEVQQYFTPQSWAKLAAAVEQGLADGTPYVCDAETVRPDGSHRWITARGEATRDDAGNIIAMHGTVQDITDRKHAETALRESEERLRLALDATSDGLWDWNLISGAVFRSSRYYEIIGRRPDEDRGDFEFFKSTVHPDDMPRVLENIEAHKRGETPVIKFDYRLVGGSLLDRWIEVKGKMVERDASGVPVRMLGTLSDITEGKQAEAEIRRLNASLEQRVAERTAELSTANRELESFAYAVSHDLRAPLRAMSGFSRALVEDYGDALEGDAREYLDQIDIASRKMGELIDGILTLSRSTRGELQRDDIDISALASGVLEELARSEPLRAVTWEVEPGLLAWGDARMLEAVLRNLLGNAWKYTGNIATPLIRVVSGEVEGQRGFCVVDNGAGFDMAYSNRLFQPFQRLHRQDEFPGLGIGLATVQRIVHRHGGWVYAEGRPGEGAQICIALPADVNTGSREAS